MIIITFNPTIKWSVASQAIILYHRYCERAKNSKKLSYTPNSKHKNRGHGCPLPSITKKRLQISLSRILSSVIIHLRELPAVGYGHTMWQPICSCSGWSLPSITITSYLVSSYLTISPLPASRRYLFCCTSRKLALPRRYLAPCPLESGLSSDLGSAITFQSVVLAII